MHYSKKVIITKISVAMCTFNGERYLEEQIDSILTQTLLPDEIIICDDGSTDNTRDILEKYSVNPIIKVYYNKINLGSTRNFEQAIKLCSGDLIFLSDQDDVWVNKKIKTIIDVFNSSSDIYMVFTDAFVTDEQLNPMELSLWDYIEFNYNQFNLYTLFVRTVVTGATMAFRKDALEGAFPLHLGFVHDEWLALIMTTLYSNGVVPINKKLIYYRQHSAQQIGINLTKSQSWFVKLRIKIFGVSVRHYQKNLSKLKIVVKQLEKFNYKPLYKELVEYTVHLETRTNISESKNKAKRWQLIKEDYLRYLKFDNFFVALKDLIMK